MVLAPNYHQAIQQLNVFFESLGPAYVKKALFA